MIPKFSYLGESGELQVRPLYGTFSCFRYTSMGRFNALHYHTTYSVVLVLKGRLDITSCGYSFSADAPLVMLDIPFMPHSTHAWEDSEYERYVMYAAEALMNRFTPQVIDFDRLQDANLVWAKPCPKALEKLTHLMRQLELTEDEEDFALLLPVFMRILLGEVDAGRGEIVKTPHPFINSVLQELAENMDAPPTIDDVCRRTGVGRSKLQRDFKAVTGMPWHRYLTLIRMKRAREFLLNGESILRTALSCGYSTESHFILAYRQYYGETPGTFIGRNDRQPKT